MTKSRNINRPKRSWMPAELRLLKREYPNRPTSEIALRLKCTVGRVYRQAWLLGLKKSEEFLAGPYNGRIHKGHAERGAAYRFVKGSAPHNKGLRRPGWHRGRMQETQFKKGLIPHTWKPVGTLVINADGYLVRKVSETGRQRDKWVPVHRQIWIDANGPIPTTHAVCFKPGMRSTKVGKIVVGALELISRGELARRNRMWTRYPHELASVMQLRGALKRQISKRERAHV